MSIPTSFPRYVDLAVELKRLIVQQAFADFDHKEFRKSAESPRKSSIGQYACIDRVWQDVIERYTFERLVICSNCMEYFGKICSKRHGILRHITLTISPDDIFKLSGWDVWSLTEADANAMLSYVLNCDLWALFDIMKDWSPEERRRRKLIRLNLSLYAFRGWPREPIHSDFSNLPRVSVIGTLWTQNQPFLHPSTAISLYKRLPNLYQAPLHLTWQPTQTAFFHEAMNAIQSLRKLPCIPSKVTLYCEQLRGLGWGWKGFQVELPLIHCLTSPDPRWSDTITKLDLPSINNVPQFLRESQTALWPHLKTLILGGMFIPTHLERSSETGGSVVESLIGALSKMPKVITVNIRVGPSVGWKGMTINVSLGKTHSSPEVVPFVLETNNGMAQISRVSVPGNLATELQDVILRHHGLELAVFCTPGYLHYGAPDLDDPDDDWSWDTRPINRSGKCKQWNREKGKWDCFTLLPVSTKGSRSPWVLVEDFTKPDTSALGDWEQVD